jgi:RNA polymerase sigma-70 factor (sigma-E family)
MELLADQGVAVVDFDEWVAARGLGLLRLAYVLTGDRHDAEDVLQDVLSRALPRWERISSLEDPDAYVRRMIANAHTSAWRRFRRRETPVAEVRLQSEAHQVGDADLAERDRVWRACLALPKDQRIAVVLRFYEDLDYSAIAALTGVREGSVRSRVSRGMAVLRKELDDE